MNDEIVKGDVVSFLGIPGKPDVIKESIEIGSLSEVLKVIEALPGNAEGRYLITTSHPWKLLLWGFLAVATATATHESCYKKLPPAEPVEKKLFALSDLGIKIKPRVES